MRKLLAGFVLAAAALSGGAEPAAAAGTAPWCAVISIGRDTLYEDCHYRSIEDCRPNVISGLRGFCSPNPAYVEPANKPAKSRAHRK